MKTEMCVGGSLRAGVTRTGLLFLAILGFVLAVNSRGQAPVFSPSVNIDQDELFSGTIPLRKALESGRQFWTTPFQPVDGMGEGPSGPRAAQRAWMYPGNPTFPFLRVHGIDSQSCFECHNTIGSYVQPGSATLALTRKPTTVSGSAGFNSDAFINPLFPNPVTLLVRNPPHVFGAGYVQELAMEMTNDLLATREAAHALSRKTPGVKTPLIDLASKGISFGKFSTTYISDDKYDDDTSQVAGVSNDLIVRPFQWKGIASSLRHFVRDALDFHFSMQAVEKVGHVDMDGDGKIDEVTPGNVAAISAFVGMTRPPVMDPKHGENAQVDAGARLFQGNDKNRMCATCHEPFLQLEQHYFYIEKANAPEADEVRSMPKIPNLVDPEFPKRELPARRAFHMQLDAAKALNVNILKLENAESIDKFRESFNANLTPEATRAALAPAFLAIDLSPPTNADLPAYVFDRLTEKSSNGKLLVPLFSDLKRHDMGLALQDNPAPYYLFPGYSQPGQPTDAPQDEGIVVPPRLFLTRPLWGVADTGPWLHDGRARTLKEAIEMHRGDGSEANPVIDAFDKLSGAEQDQIIAFLLSLHLPIEKGYK